jgi:hypothetical protein
MLGDIELQPRDIAEQRNGVGTDIRERPSRGRRCVQVRIDRDLLFREIGAPDLRRRLGAGLPVICVDARHAKAALSLKVNKTDANPEPGRS